ncbi:virulence associated lipoprotein [Borreliella valaisiana]|uniref:virulence associated lipoprotein n=2 Tax=Borreliella valaisiana TaxID=62088 RepID=UPI001F1C494F|nr:virulence associated lipoprotein [Borreliella valaisiana]
MEGGTLSLARMWASTYILKKDTLDKLEISNLEKLKNSFKELLSTKATISETLNKLLLDYQNDENSIKTDSTKLESHVTTL